MRLIESEEIELKRSTGELKAGIISLVAMLNKHQRGELWFERCIGEVDFSEYRSAVAKRRIRPCVKGL
jgi:hypothetical protein